MTGLEALLVAFPTIQAVFLQPVYLPPQEIRLVNVTAYSSSYEETDSTPLITASNKLVRDGFVAVNGYEFGTMVMLPELYPDKVFEIQDRKNRRYDEDWLDIWMNSKQDAKMFGIKRQIKMIVL